VTGVWAIGVWSVAAEASHTDGAASPGSHPVGMHVLTRTCTGPRLLHTYHSPQTTNMQ